MEESWLIYVSIFSWNWPTLSFKSLTYNSSSITTSWFLCSPSRHLKHMEHRQFLQKALISSFLWILHFVKSWSRYEMISAWCCCSIICYYWAMPNCILCALLVFWLAVTSFASPSMRREFTAAPPLTPPAAGPPPPPAMPPAIYPDPTGPPPDPIISLALKPTAPPIWSS